MTDEQYIEKLYLKGFSNKQVNQLLKIYTYTTFWGLDLSSIDTSVDDGELRRIALSLKNHEFNNLPDLINVLKMGLNYGIDIISFFNPDMNHNVLSRIIDCAIKGYDITELYNPKYSMEHLNCLIIAIKKGYDISYLTNTDYSVVKLELILEAFDNDLDIKPYLSDYSDEQLKKIIDILSNNKRLIPIDLSLVIKPEYSAFQMDVIEDALRDGIKDISILQKTCYKQEHLRAIFNLLTAGKDISYIVDKDLNMRQVNTIEENMDLMEDDIDYSLIFNKKYNWAFIDMFTAITNNEKLVKYLDYFLDKNYSFEKFQEIIYGIKNDLDISKYENLNDIKEIHFIRRMLEYNKKDPSFDISYYLNSEINIDYRIKDYIKSKQTGITYKIIEENEPEKTKLPWELDIYGDQKMFFLTEQETIVEIGIDEWYDNSELDEGMGIIDDKSFIDSLNNKELLNSIEDFFIIRYNEKSDCLEIYDLLKDKVIDENVEYLDWSNAYNYTLEPDVFFKQLSCDTLDYFSFGCTEEYQPAFLLDKDINKATEYGGPDIQKNGVIINYICEHEYHTLSLTMDQIRKMYGDTSQETLNLVYTNLIKEADEISNFVKSDPFYFIHYDMDGNEIDSCYGFNNKYALDNIQFETSNFVSNLGIFKNVKSCLENYLNEIDVEIEER